MVALIQVQCLEEVVRTRSFRAAASVLHMSQPAVSGHVARLERELGLQLLQRSPTGSELTVQGRRLIPHLRAFVESEAAILRASESLRTGGPQQLTVSSHRRGMVRILPDAFAVLRESFGSLVVHLHQDGAIDAREGLRDGSCDIALAIEPDDDEAGRGIDKTHMLSLGQLGVCGPVGHPLLNTGDPIAADELGAESLITLTTNSTARVLGGLLPRGARNFSCEVDDTEVAMALVRAGLGLAVMLFHPYELATGSLRWRPMSGSPSFSIHLLSSSVTALSPAGQALHSYLMSWRSTVTSMYAIDPVRGVTRTRLAQPSNEQTA